MVGSQVASQACVPHQDVALVIALLSLWSDIGAAIGSAISVGVWSAYMPGNLRLYLPASVTDEEVAVFFGNSEYSIIRGTPTIKDLLSAIQSWPSKSTHSTRRFAKERFSPIIR